MEYLAVYAARCRGLRAHGGSAAKTLPSQTITPATQAASLTFFVRQLNTFPQSGALTYCYEYYIKVIET